MIKRIIQWTSLHDSQFTNDTQGITTERRAWTNYWNLVKNIVAALNGINVMPKWLVKKIENASKIRSKYD